LFDQQSNSKSFYHRPLFSIVHAYTMTSTIDISKSTNAETSVRAALNSYRQQRDEAHRGQQLANERLRLVTEEYKVVESSVESAKKHLDQLKGKAGDSPAAREELLALQREVEHLTKEVRPQKPVIFCYYSYYLLFASYPIYY